MYNAKGLPRPYVASLSHGAWHLVPTPTVNANDGVLTGVSCWNAGHCEVVGVSGSLGDQGSGMEGYSARLSGKSWSYPTVEVPTGGVNITRFTSVSCTSASTCTIVGTYSSTTSGDLSLAASGPASGPFTSVPPLGTSATGVVLEAVSCTSSTCVAVGQGGDQGYGYVATGAGATWAASTISLPASLKAPVLNGVACVVRACVAVGSVDKGKATPPLVATG
jgi:hypothetical protein